MTDRIRKLLTSNLAVRQQVRQKIDIVNVDDNSTTIYLYDVIDNDPYWGFTALELAALLNEVKTPTVTLRINSPGGSVFEGRTMATLLAQFSATVHVKIDGLCASAATTVALAGDSIEMAEGGMFMIHEASTWTSGTKNDLRKIADELEKIEQSIVNDYVRRTSKTEDEIKDWMEAETYFTAKEALAAGFVDSVWIPDTPDTDNRMSWNTSAFKNSAVITNAGIHLLKQEPVSNGVPDNLKRQANMLATIC